MGNVESTEQQYKTPVWDFIYGVRVKHEVIWALFLLECNFWIRYILSQLLFLERNSAERWIETEKRSLRILMPFKLNANLILKINLITHKKVFGNSIPYNLQFFMPASGEDTPWWFFNSQLESLSNSILITDYETPQFHDLFHEICKLKL